MGIRWLGYWYCRFEVNDAAIRREAGPPLRREDANHSSGPFSNSGFETDPAKLHPNLAKRGFSKPDHAILAGAGFETGLAERARRAEYSVGGLGSGEIYHLVQ